MTSYPVMMQTEHGEFRLGQVIQYPRGWRFVSWTSGYSNSKKLFDSAEEAVKRFKNVRLVK